MSELKIPFSPNKIVRRFFAKFNREGKMCALDGEDFMQQHISSVSRDLKDGFFSDFKIIVADREIPVHRIILNSASYKFEAMFELDMMEKREGKVYINDRSYDAVKGLVDYIYGNEVSNATDVCRELLEMAEEYNIPMLKNDCENYIKGRLNHSNVYETLVHAYRNNASDLVESALRHITDHRKELINKENIASLESDLKDILIEYMANSL